VLDARRPDTLAEGFARSCERGIASTQAARTVLPEINSLAPIVHIAPGATITVEMQNASGGQLSATSTASDLATLDFGPDLLQAARDATTAMIAEIVRRTTISEVDAYLLASVAGDLKISEVVDVPNWVVSLHTDAALLR
jgi:acetamidase/formamidase